MDKNYFLAKTYKNKDGSYKTETIEEHTGKLLLLFDNFMNIYGGRFPEEKELIYIACQTHDLGKMNSRFQKKLYKAIGKEKDYKKDEDLEKLYDKLQIKEIPHGVLSASFIDIPKLKEKFDDEYIEVLASAIYNHHARAVVDTNGSNIVDTSIKDIVDNDIAKYIALYDDAMKCSFRGVKKNVVKDNSNNTYSFYLKFIVVKGMLNKLDYGASAGIETLEIEPNNACKCVRKKFEDKNFDLNDCQKFMESNSDKNLVVVASTGIGKTEGALLWAGASKTFYTLPVKVSINSIYERILKEDYYGEKKEDKEKVTFLHSDTRSMMMEKYENNKENEDDYEKKYIETRHLIHPLTVCTVDQLFYFVFKSLGTEKFPATLKYSKVIIDEIQSYTPDITAFLIYGLKVITDLGGQFLIMTATLPPVVKHFLIETIGENRLKIADNPFFKKDDENRNIMQRHFIKYIETDFDYNDIVEQAKSKKVLVICNTVKRAQKVYTRLKEHAGIVDLSSLNKKDIKDYLKKKVDSIDISLLHSRFILKDRKLKEHCILEFAKSAKKGIWISTQIVEASLDIDFDILYTDMATADSLLQRMGRCYRNRVYRENTANLFIHNNIDDKRSMGVGSVYDEDVFNLSVEFIKDYNNKIFSEEEKQKYINNVYDVEKLKSTKYYQSIKKNIEDLQLLPLGGVDTGIAERQFRNINNITVIPLMFENTVNELVEKLNNCNDKKDRVKKIEEIKSYTTSIFYNAHFDKNIKGFLKEKLKSKYLNQIIYIDLPYDETMGLRNRTDDELEEYREKEREKQFI